MAGYSHRTAQPPTLAAFRPWEGSAGAGRVRPAAAKIRMQRLSCELMLCYQLQDFMASPVVSLTSSFGFHGILLPTPYKMFFKVEAATPPKRGCGVIKIEHRIEIETQIE